MKRLTTVAALLLACSSAIAGRPLVAETADSLEAGTVEIEASWLKATLDGGRVAHAGETTVQYGIGHSTQVGLAYARGSGVQTLQAVQLAGKTTFVAPAQGQAGWGIAYRATAIKTDGGAYEGELFTVAGLMTRELADAWLLHANLGVARNRLVNETRARWWLGLERTGTLALAADVFGNNAGESYFSTGIGWTFSESFAVNAAAAWQLGGGSARDLSLGLRLTF